MALATFLITVEPTSRSLARGSGSKELEYLDSDRLADYTPSLRGCSTTLIPRASWNNRDKLGIYGGERSMCFSTPRSQR